MSTERLIMTNGMDPSQMTPAERIDEVGMLLSLAMMRLWLKRRAGTGQRSFSRDSAKPARTGLELSLQSSPDGTVIQTKE